MSSIIESYTDADLTRADVVLFSSGCWLNSSCINYAYRRIEEELENELKGTLGDDSEALTKGLSVLQSILMMDPSVVSFLVTYCSEDEEFEDLSNGIEICKRSWILLPVNNNDSAVNNMNASHWSLLACHVSSGSLFHFDSCQPSNNLAAKRVATNLYRLLKRREEPVVINVKTAPQQSNGNDCGVYAILVAKRIAQLVLSTCAFAGGDGGSSGGSSHVCPLVEDEGARLASGVKEWVTVDAVRQFRAEISSSIEARAKERAQGGGGKK